MSVWTEDRLGVHSVMSARSDVISGFIQNFEENSRLKKMFLKHFSVGRGMFTGMGMKVCLDEQSNEIIRVKRVLVQIV